MWLQTLNLYDRVQGPSQPADGQQMYIMHITVNSVPDNITESCEQMELTCSFYNFRKLVFAVNTHITFL
jgi:hypothetical protein